MNLKKNMIIANDKIITPQIKTINYNQRNNVLRRDYFNLTDSDIRIDHDWGIHYPICDSLEYNYFIKNGLVVHNVQELKALIQSVTSKGQSIVEVKCRFDIMANDILQLAAGLRSRHTASYKEVKVLYNDERHVFAIRFME